MKTDKKFKMRGMLLIVCILFLTVIAMNSQAQTPTPAPTPAPDQTQTQAQPQAQSPEAVKPSPKSPVITTTPFLNQDHTKAWETEAQYVAEDLTLSSDLAAKLADAYKSARKAGVDAVLERMKQSDGLQEKMAAITEIANSGRKKLEENLKLFLSPEQTTKAMESLGLLSAKWDLMVETINGFNLEAEPKKQALKLITDFSVQTAKLMKLDSSQEERKKNFGQVKSVRDKLDSDLAKILTHEQATKWMEATARPRVNGNAAKPDNTNPTAPQAPAAPQEEKK